MDSPLRLARLSRELTLEQAAALVNLDTSTLSRIERTGRTGRNTAARLAEVFLMSEEHVLYPERYAPSEPQQKTA